MHSNKNYPINPSYDEYENLDPTDESVLEDAPAMITSHELAHDLNKEKVRLALRKAGTKGATPQEISNAISIGPQTVKKCLEELCSTREAYRLKRNRTTTMYYYNGRPRHDFGVERVEDGNTVFELSLAEGPHESLLLHIIEKRFTLLEGEQIEGGVIIPLSQVQAITERIERLQKLAGAGNEV